MSAQPAVLPAAASNNALWCDTICRAHGKSGEFSPHRWICRVDAPPLYPNLVTLGDASRAAVAAQLGAIDALMTAGLSLGWAIKDSFRALDLAPRGFAHLFDAVWIASGAGLTAVDNDSLRMTMVRDGAALAAWEAAWRRDQSLASNELPERLFSETLLANPEIAFLAAIREGSIVAGAVANRGAGAVGISNLFCGGEQPPAVWAATIALLSPLAVWLAPE
ncbi:MAG: hypothetical protein SGJ07_16700 [Rhodospirillaceae bacterium]|nr:hypothetical protein [Rhodospirillaceae bacterium]